MSPRTPSIVSRTCERKPAAHAHGNLLEPVSVRTVSPSVHPRPASGGATDFFLASALSVSPTGLATSRWRRRAMRPTDVCHPNELRAPAPRAFPVRSRHFRSGDAPRRLRLRAALPGDRTFHDVRKTASADRRCNTRLVLLVSRRLESPERGRFLPTVLTRSSL
jgi:hypothetical protein